MKRVALSASVPILLIGVILGFVVRQAEAQEGSSLTMSLEAGFDGYFRRAEWFPVVITLSNNGPDLVGVVSVHPTGGSPGVTFTTPVELPSQSHKRIMMAVFVDGFVREITAELIVGGEVIISATDEVAPLAGSDVFCLVLGRRAGAAFDLADVAGRRWNIYQASISPDQVPESAEALRSADVIFVREADTGRLTEMQKEALADWVLSGGHLIVTGGIGWQATVAGLGDLMPVHVEGVIEVDASPLVWFAGGDSLLDGTVQAATGELSEGATALLSTDDGEILLARRDYGIGAVDYLAVDPASGILRRWEGWDRFWFSLLTMIGPEMPWVDGIQDEWGALANVGIMPFVDLLSARQFCLLSLSYTLLIGPGAYMVLKRLRRLELGWIVIPAVALTAALGFYFAGVAVQGLRPIVGRMDVIQSWPNSDRARVDGIMGVWGPERGNYNVEFEPGFAMRPILPDPSQSPWAGQLQDRLIVLEEGDSFSMPDMPMPVLYDIGLGATGYRDAPGLAGEATIAVGASRVEVTGRVINGTDMRFDDCYALILDTSYRIGPLEPGEEADFSLGTVADTPIPPRYGNIERQYFVTLPPASAQSPQMPPPILAQPPMSSPRYPDLLVDTSVMYDDSPQGRESRRRYSLVSALTANPNAAWDGNAYAMCWTDRPPFEALVNGLSTRLAATTLVISQLQTNLNPESADGELLVPVGMMRWYPGRSPGATQATPISSGSTSIMTGGDYLEFGFAPLDVIRLSEVTAVILDVRGSGNSAPVVDLWSWDEGEWIEVGTGWGQMVITGPDAFVGPGNAVEVRVRVGSQTDSFMVDRVTASLRGYHEDAARVADLRAGDNSGR